MSSELPHEKLEENSNINIDHILAENEELLAEIKTESNNRKNKNIVNNRLAVLINKLERNLILVSKDLPPECICDPDHVSEEKARFIHFYSRKNGVKK